MFTHSLNEWKSVKKSLADLIYDICVIGVISLISVIPL